MRVDPQVVLAAVEGKRPNAEGRVRARCPLCDGRRETFSFHPGEGFFSCFRCGARGRIHVTGATYTAPAAARPAMRAPDGYVPLWTDDAWASRACAPARDYLLGRRIDRALIRRASIGAAVHRGKAFGRVIVPIFGTDGETWLGWSGRVWVRGKVERPYRYADGMERAYMMFNHRALLQPRAEPGIVVEGVFDVLGTSADDSVAVLGKPSPWQIDALLISPRPLSIVFDGDAWQLGLATALQLRVRGLERYKEGDRLDPLRVGTVRLPPGKDPDEYPIGTIREAAALSLTRVLPVAV